MTTSATSDRSAIAGGFTGPSRFEPAPEQQAHPREINVGWQERKLSILGGVGLALLGLAKGRLSGLAMLGVGGALLQRGFTGHCAVYGALGRNTAQGQTSAEPEEYFNRSIHVETSVTVNRTPEELFQFWRNFENLPRFMNHLESVQCLDGNRSRWSAKAPAGFSVQWDAEIINEEPNALIAWRSVGGADVDNAGSVRFLPAPGGDRGTEVRVVIDYIPPAGKLGSVVAKLFGEEPSVQVREDLRRFKQLMETGEIPTIEGQPRGKCG